MHHLNPNLLPFGFFISDVHPPVSTGGFVYLGMKKTLALLIYGVLITAALYGSYRYGFQKRFYPERVFRAINNRELYFTEGASLKILADSKNLATFLMARITDQPELSSEERALKELQVVPMYFDLPNYVEANTYLHSNESTDTIGTDVYKTITFKYRVKINSQTRFATLHFLKEFDGYKLGAFFVE